MDTVFESESLQEGDRLVIGLYRGERLLCFMIGSSDGLL